MSNQGVGKGGHKLSLPRAGIDIAWKASVALLGFIVGGIFTSIASPYLNHTLIPGVMRILRSREAILIYSMDAHGNPSLDEKYDLYFSWGSTEPQGRMIEDGHEEGADPIDYIFGGTHVSNMLAFAFRKSDSTTSGGGAYTGFDYKNDGIYVGTLSGFAHDTQNGKGCAMSSRWAVVGDFSKKERFIAHLTEQIVAKTDNTALQPSPPATKSSSPASQSAPQTPLLPSPDAQQPVQLLMNCPDSKQKSAAWSKGNVEWRDGVESRYSAS